MTGLTDVDYARIMAVLAGTEDADDLAWIQAWRVSSPANEALLAHLERTKFAMERAGRDQLDVRMARLRQVVEAHIETNPLSESSRSAHNFSTAVEKKAERGMAGLGRQTPRRGVWYAAMSIVIGVFGVVIGRNERTSHILGSSPKAVSAYVTTNGERANITLPDGTAITLGVASRLEVPADYTTGNHTVRLNGQAMFNVVSQQATPFTVLAGATAARVLGTSFMVRHYPTDTTTTVAVRNGKVAVRSLIVTAAKQVEISKTGVVRMRAASAAQFSFAVGVLTLNGAVLSDAIPELDRWYNVDIRLGDPTLATRRIAGEYVAGSIADLAEVLGEPLSLRVVRSGRVLTLYPE